MPNIQIDLPEKLIPVFTTPNKDYRGAYGGRGAAKTIAFANMAIFDIMRLSDKPWRFLCGRELQKSLKDSVFPSLRVRLNLLVLKASLRLAKSLSAVKRKRVFFTVCAQTLPRLRGYMVFVVHG